jgi:hypothetical protein
MFDSRIKIDGVNHRFDGMIIPSGDNMLIASIDRDGNIFGNLKMEKSISKNPITGNIIIGIKNKEIINSDKIGFIFEKTLEGKAVDKDDRDLSVDKLRKYWS